MLSERNLELLKKNAKSVFYEPLVAASAFAFAAVLDRVRYGTLPSDSAAESLRQHAALLACNLAAKPEAYIEFRRHCAMSTWKTPAVDFGRHSRWLVCKVDLEILHPNAKYLAIAVVLDLCIGDPVYPFHPVRLIGRLLTVLEQFLRRSGGTDTAEASRYSCCLLPCGWRFRPLLLSFSFPRPR
jgi:hypothetical protein